MATVLRRALANPADSATYEMLMAELNKPQAPAAPTFTPEEVRQRIAQNNSEMALGTLGQLAGNEDVRNVGGQVFKRAIGNRTERVTNRGIQDPLTGKTAIDPEYADEKETARRDVVLKMALGWQDQRARAQERQDLRATIAAGQAGNNQLKDDLTRARVDLVKNQSQAILDKMDAADDKAAAGVEAAQTGLQRANAKAAFVTGEIDKALKQTGPFTTGAMGAVLGKLPIGEAYDLRATINTVKANIGFDELQAMRLASPTGGALGQVAVKELDMLQATLGNLDANQSRGQLEKNLKAIRTHYDKWRQAVELHTKQVAARNTTRSTTGAGSSAPPPAQPGTGTVPPPASPGAAPPPAADARPRRRWNTAIGDFETVAP